MRKKWSRQIPNALSGLRLLLSPLLIIFFSRPSLFLSLYALCGLSDVLDGYLARRNGWASSFGQKLDSAADLVFFASLASVLAFEWGIRPFAAALPLIAAVILVRLGALLAAYVKFRTLAIVHTLANKASGLLVYLALPLFRVLPEPRVVEAVSLFCLLAAIEELLIHLTSSELDRDRLSLFLPPRRH
jgi:phosphatidylglycerophosphate synthase